MHSVKSAGATGLTLLGKGNSKELELEAADAATRDVWVSGGESEAGEGERSEIETDRACERMEIVLCQNDGAG